jgi:hypothetical protein
MKHSRMPNQWRVKCTLFWGAASGGDFLKGGGFWGEFFWGQDEEHPRHLPLLER